jgi:hypothetical protein
MLTLLVRAGSHGSAQTMSACAARMGPAVGVAEEAARRVRWLALAADLCVERVVCPLLPVVWGPASVANEQQI